MAPPRKPNPYKSAGALAAAIADAGGLAPLGQRISTDRATIRKWARELGVTLGKPVTSAQTGDPTEKAAEHSTSDPTWVLEAIDALGDGATVEGIADRADVSPWRVREAINAARDAGYRIPEPTDGRVVLEKVAPAPSDFLHEAPLQLFAGDRIKFGVASDTHLSSRECHIADLHAAYDLFAEEGITDVFHPGDITAGIGVYRHQHRDLAPWGHTFDEQIAYAVEHYPKRDGITTRIISGNHDVEGNAGLNGIDLCLAIANQRDDLVHGGVYSAWYELANGAKLHMLHPGGGASYADSYRPQKHAESYETGRKPNIVLFGHWHRTGFFYKRGIALLLAGAFEGTTDLATRKALGEANVGCWIVEATLADDGTLTRIKPEWVPFYNGRRA